MEWDALTKKLGWNEQDYQRDFVDTVYELEGQKGRPVYFIEVLYHLHEKAGATEKLSDDAKDHVLRLKEKAIKSRSMGRVAVGEVLDAYKKMTGTAKNKELFLADFQKEMREEINRLANMGYKTRNIFTENDPLLYSLHGNEEKDTIFYKMDGGKSEKNVARQVARWLKQGPLNRKSYLEPEK